MSDIGLFQTQSQKLVIGPQMQQSLGLLQAATMDLRHLIQQEMEANPVLEMESPEVSLDEAHSDDPDDDDRELRELSQMDEEWRDYLSQSKIANPRRDDDDERMQFVMDSIVVPSTLQDHLQEQLRMAENVTARTLELIDFLIGSLDDAGYLTSDLDDLSLSQGIPLAELEQAHRVLTRLDPAGIGARNLRQSLLIQLERLGYSNSLAHRLVHDSLDDLANKRYAVLAKQYSVPVAQISRAADLIGTLDPRPASRFTEGRNHYVSPDVFVEKVGTEWVASMNNDEIPRLRISNSYKDLIAQAATSPEVREYVRDKVKGGKFLIRCIQQRQNTIHRIAEELIRHQVEFLEKGRSFLRPLNMAQIADEIGVHETTVSRAISGKYIRTPHGVFELKFFFSQGLKTEGGEDMSNTSVKDAVAEIIAGESLKKPLSDDKIAKMLQQRGIHVARRTVAKYREGLNILPSHLRKSFS